MGGVTTGSEDGVGVCCDGIGSGCWIDGVTLGCCVSGCTGEISLGVGTIGVTELKVVATDTSSDQAPVTQSVAEAITK